MLPERNEPILLVIGSVTVHNIEPPGSTKFGVQGNCVVLALFTETNSCGFLIGYSWELVRKRPMVVACVTVFVAIIMSLQYAPLTKLHVFDTS